MPYTVRIWLRTTNTEHVVGSFSNIYPAKQAAYAAGARVRDELAALLGDRFFFGSCEDQPLTWEVSRCETRNADDAWMASVWITRERPVSAPAVKVDAPVSVVA